MGKKVTMTDIANELGVSQTLVSFVLSGKNDKGISADTKKKVLRTAEKLGYCSNAASRMLKLGRSGYIVLSFANGTEAVDSAVIGGICNALHGFGYELVMLSPTEASDADYCIGLIGDGRADGILIYGEDEALAERMRSAGIKVEVIANDNAENALECGKKLCEAILDCAGAKNAATVKKKAVHKRTAAVSKANNTVTRVDDEDNAVKDTSPVPEAKKPSKTQESIWLL